METMILVLFREEVFLGVTQVYHRTWIWMFVLHLNQHLLLRDN